MKSPLCNLDSLIFFGITEIMDSYAYYGHRASPVNLNAPNDDYSQDVDTSKIVVDAPTFTNLPESCDKFRILVIGKAGVGKSTICSTVFGVPPEKVNSCPT